ncbi:MAG: LysR family transcriptional regulator [Flexilinea sp.]|nr:LysR family transcriptional regulator [Flexilinea sp.]
MEIRVLQYFLTIVQEENISKAADVLHITQPTLSRQIQQLEEELGTTLFIRGRKLELTDAGIMLKRRAEELSSLMDRIENDFAQKKDIGGIVSIGSGGLYSTRILPEIMAAFKQKYPKVEFQLHTNNADNIKDMLDEGIIDFGLLLEPVDVDKFDYIRMKDMQFWMNTITPTTSQPTVTTGIRKISLCLLKWVFSSTECPSAGAASFRPASKRNRIRKGSPITAVFLKNFINTTSNRW